MAENKKIMIVAGEASGDLHGSNLIKKYNSTYDNVRFYGIGSSKMKAAGMEVLHDSKEIAVVGIIEVLSHFGAISRVFNDLKKRLYEGKPDLLILIDFPDFNLRLAKHAKRAGVKVLYYVSPQVWAWRKGRIKKIAKLVDKMAVIFPFEVELYEKEGGDVTFVGHPLKDCVRPTIERDVYLRAIGVPTDKKIITVVPGSREGELNRFFHELMEACEIIQKTDENYYFLVSAAPTIEKELISEGIKKYQINAKVFEGDIYNAVSASYFVITKSGTSTLETAILCKPMVIVYKVAPFSYFIGKSIFSIDTDIIGLANIVAGEKVVPEVIQDEVSAGAVASAALRILDDKSIYDDMVSRLNGVKGKLGDGNASENVAALVNKILYDEKNA